MRFDYFLVFFQDDESQHWVINPGRIVKCNIFLGKQSGFTKFPCFLCPGDTRARAEHWERKTWTMRDVMVVGEKNVIAEPLVDRSKTEADYRFLPEGGNIF